MVQADLRKITTIIKWKMRVFFYKNRFLINLIKDHLKKTLATLKYLGLICIFIIGLLDIFYFDTSNLIMGALLVSFSYLVIKNDILTALNQDLNNIIKEKEQDYFKLLGILRKVASGKMRVKFKFGGADGKEGGANILLTEEMKIEKDKEKIIN